MITDLDAVNFCAATYSSPAQFDTVYSGVSDDDVWCGVKTLSDCCVVAFRGSSDFLDWQRDLDSVMITDPDLGGVEQGFMQGMREVSNQLANIISAKPLCITGHSLGAARALIFAGLLEVAGAKPEKVVTFGSPKPGAEKLKFILSGVAINSYRNRHDPVTNCPIDLLGLPYVHPRDLIAVDAPPPQPDPWGFLADHHISLYIQAMKGLQNEQPSP
jgi:hypothetical protein